MLAERHVLDSDCAIFMFELGRLIVEQNFLDGHIDRVQLHSRLLCLTNNNRLARHLGLSVIQLQLQGIMLRAKII